MTKIKKDAKKISKSASRKSDDPRLFGEILDDFLTQSDSPLAVGYRQFVASLKGQQNGNGSNSPCNGTTGHDGKARKKPWSCDTDMGVDLKTILFSAERMKTGRWYRGVICRDREGVLDEFLCRDPHYVFIETPGGATQKRNPRVFEGRYITITQCDDGTLRPNFKHLDTGTEFSIERYALGVYNELCTALEGLVEK